GPVRARPGDLQPVLRRAVRDADRPGRPRPGDPAVRRRLLVDAPALGVRDARAVPAVEAGGEMTWILLFGAIAGVGVWLLVSRSPAFGATAASELARLDAQRRREIPRSLQSEDDE